MKKICILIGIILTISVILSISISSIINNSTIQYISKFDVPDTTMRWHGDVDEISDNKLIIYFKKSTTNPEFKLIHLKEIRAIKFEYISYLPPDYYYKPGYESYLNNYRQCGVITLSTFNKKQISQIIRKIEKLEFVYSVTPNVNLELC